MKLVIAEKETNEDEDNPVKFLATNKINAPIATYESLLRDAVAHRDVLRILKQNLGLEDCEIQTNEGASAGWHLLMVAYGIVCPDSYSSAL